MTELPAYLTGLIIAVALAGLSGWRFRQHRWQLWRVGIAVALNWALGSFYVWQTGDYTPWMFSIVLDALTAVAVMWHPAGRMQVYIGLFYALQIAAHIAFGGRQMFGFTADPIYYYDAITYVAWAQLTAIGVWTGGLWSRSLFHRDRRGGNAVDRPARVGHHRK